MATQVDICNIALTSLGDQRIVSLSDNNERARLCSARYDDVRDAVLRAYHWNCVTKRVQLTASSDAPVWGYTTKFPLPADCLRVLDVQSYEIPFEVEGRFIVTDASTCYLLYIAKVTDETQYDALLVQTIGARLAMEIAEPLTGRRDLRQDMTAKYQALLAEARSADSAERGLPKTIESDVFVAARL
jgi:hypothetical protein